MNEMERDELIRLAEDLANGRSIDWANATSSTSPSVLRAVEQLRVIQGIRRVQSCTWGPFELRERLATGTYGDVYVAHDPTLARDVALKLLRDDRMSARAQTAFVQEARKLARVRHANVVTIHGADVHDDRAGLWMELVRGRTLEEILREHGPLSAAEASRIGVELCGALAAIHAAGLVHRDVKTTNVVREDGGRIVLMDLGAAVDLARDDSSLGEGTPLYLSPERVAGREATPADDVYALGVVLYRLVTGRYPVDARSWADLIARPRTSLRDARADLPADFVRAIDRALSDDPSARFATAGELERALAGATTTPHTRTTRPRLLWAAGVVLVLAAAGALVARAPRTRPAPSPASAPAPVQRGPLTARATLTRITSAGDSPLSSGDRIRPGDALSLTFSSAESVYAYVIDEDAAGTATVLFPAPGLDRVNPLPPSATHRLPGAVAGTTKYWQVTSAGGREVITVIASRTPLTEFEADIAQLAQAAPGAPLRYASLSAPAVRRLRGIASLADAPRTTERPLGDAVRRAASDTPDIWTWQTTLQNP